jgi:serine/threonine protein kinase
MHVKIGDLGLATTIRSSAASVDTSPQRDDPPVATHDVGELCAAPLAHEHGRLEMSPDASGPTLGVGTFLYTAPEVLAENPNSRYDAKCDVFSLGVLLFEMFFVMNTRMERTMVLTELRAGRLPATFVSEQPLVATIVRQLVHHDPSHRPTARELCVVLPRVVVGGTSPVREMHGLLARRTSRLSAALEASGGASSSASSGRAAPGLTMLSPERRASDEGHACGSHGSNSSGESAVRTAGHLCVDVEAGGSSPFVLHHCFSSPALTTSSETGSCGAPALSFSEMTSGGDAVVTAALNSPAPLLSVLHVLSRGGGETAFSTPRQLGLPAATSLLPVFELRATSGDVKSAVGGAADTAGASSTSAPPPSSLLAMVTAEFEVLRLRAALADRDQRIEMLEAALRSHGLHVPAR